MNPMEEEKLDPATIAKAFRERDINAIQDASVFHIGGHSADTEWIESGMGKGTIFARWLISPAYWAPSVVVIVVASSRFREDLPVPFR